MVKKQSESNAQILLCEYRVAIWRKSAFEKITRASQKVSQAYAEQICFTEELVELLRSNKRLGEKFYWIIYASYMTERQPDNVDEILEEIAQNYKAVSRRTYFRLKGRAIEILDNFLNELEKNEFAKQDNCLALLDNISA
jgi:hypothetical protein